MANWAQLRRAGGGKVWVNLDQACFIGSSGQQTNYKTIIAFAGDDEPVMVEESVDEVAGWAQRTNDA